MSDRIVIMNHGKIVQIGSPEELYEHPRTVFAAGFLGRSNFIKRDGHVLALRPEKIDVSPAGKGVAPGHLSGTVRGVTYMGAQIKLTVAVEGMKDIEVHSDAWRLQHRFTEGDSVDLSWSENAAVAVESS